MHRISDVRMGGTSKRNFKIFREICGESSLKNVLVVTNMWPGIGGEVEEAREAELASKDQFFKPALEKGAQLLRHDGTVKSARTVLRYLTDSHPTTLRIQQEIVDERKPIEQTAAGSELRQTLEEQANRHKEEIRNLRAELETAMQARDEETRGDLQKALEKKQQDYLRIIDQNSQRMAAEFAAEYARLEGRMLRMEDVYQKRLQTLTDVQRLVTRALWENKEQEPLHVQKQNEDLATKKAGDKRRTQESQERREERALVEESHQKHYVRNPLEGVGRAHTDTTKKNHVQKERQRLAALAETQPQPIKQEARLQAKTSKSWLKFPVSIRTVSFLFFCYFMFQTLQEDWLRDDVSHSFRTIFLCLFGFFW